MSSHYSNPTANAAISAVDREIHRLRKKAARLKALRQQGKLTRQELESTRKEFTGIYRRILREALEEK